MNYFFFEQSKTEQPNIRFYKQTPTCMQWHVILELVHSSYCTTDPYKIYYEIYKQIYIGRK